MFGFSIRELMLVTLVVALAVGWWADRQQRNITYLEAAQAESDIRFLLKYVEPDYIGHTWNSQHFRYLQDKHSGPRKYPGEPEAILGR
jgi:hypothetical protein